MKKRTLALIVGAVFTVSMLGGIGAAELISEIKAELRRDFTIRVDGEKQTFRNADGDKVYPILFEGTTYLPVRATGELMGKTVYWDEGKKEIDLRTEETGKTTTVTDADVIYDSTDNGKDKPAKPIKEDKPDKPGKSEKTDKVSAPENLITKEKAEEIALNKAGLTKDEATRIRTELDFDNGIWKYEVEIKDGRTEYDADIDAETGKVLKWEVDLDD